MIETKFKQTEIGLIPEDWEVMPLSILGNVKMCKRIMKYQTSETGDIPFYKIGTFGKTSDAFISRGLYEKYKQKYPYPHKGTILISAAGTVGRTVIFDGKDAYFQDSNIVWIENDESIALDKYLYYYYNIIQWKTENGGIVTRLYNDNLKSTCFAFPKSKQEQSRIAEALSNIDNLISSLSKMIEKKRLIKQGAMQQLLTGKKRLPGFDGEWEEKRLGDCAFIKARIGWQGLTTNEYLTTGRYYLVNGTNFCNGKVDWNSCPFVSKERYDQDRNIQIKRGDILISKDGTIGKVAYISTLNGEGTLNSGVFVIRSKESVVSQDYMAWIFLSPSFDEFIGKLTAGSTIKHLYQKDIVDYTFVIPHSVKEQSAIANVLTTMDNEIESLEEERGKYVQLKEGMMQKLLTGQIRLINDESKPMSQPKATVANVHFRRCVLATEIADRLCEEKTFGHVKMEKLIFLTEHLCHINIASHYHRDAAGPYDNRALHSIDSQMKKQQWFELTKKDKGYRYQPMGKRGEHKKYFDRYYADVLPMFNKVIETFKSSTTEQCEIVATLYSAWNDLLHSGHTFSDEDILNEVLNNWHESKRRINRDRWQAALNWMRSNGLVPQSENN